MPDQTQRFLEERFNLGHGYFVKPKSSGEVSAENLSIALSTALNSGGGLKPDDNIAKGASGAVLFLSQAVPGFKERFPLLFRPHGAAYDQRGDEYGLNQFTTATAELETIKGFSQIASKLWEYIERNYMNDVFLKHKEIVHDIDLDDDKTIEEAARQFSRANSFSMNVSISGAFGIKNIDFYKQDNIPPENSSEK